MTEWFYKATTTLIPYEETRDLAINDGFICRSAFEENGSRADNTQHVAFGDIVHMYYSGGGDRKVIGSFEVVGPNRHPHGTRFRRGVTDTVLFEVDDDFANKLGGLGGPSGQRYLPDPKLKKLTGWAIIHRPDLTTPAFEAAPFKGQATLVRG